MPRSRRSFRIANSSLHQDAATARSRARRSASAWARAAARARSRAASARRPRASRPGASALLAQHRESGPSRPPCGRRDRSRSGAIDAAELEIVPHRELGEDVAALRHVGDAAREQVARLQVGDVGAVEARCGPDARRQHAEHGLEHGRLAGAVRADHGGDGAARDREARAVAGSSSCRSRRRRRSSVRIASVAKIGLDHLRVAPHARRDRPRR